MNDGRATLGEGNHRAAAAHLLGLTAVPVEIIVIYSVSEESPVKNTIDVRRWLRLKPDAVGPDDFEISMKPSVVFREEFLKT